MIARRDGIDYVRCRDCGRVFEADDLEPAFQVEGDSDADD